ncbi:DNA endonuclease SmrA [Agaribacterium haliotis]|uniref:DNA endonuclease SmrA n=1 Tax=Agaribacterium haliotis TaxID=2013869 RepID=UPI000BB56B99|nr:DNA endonuclease SmrA [Agaribacterium haliotis]
MSDTDNDFLSLLGDDAKEIEPLNSDKRHQLGHKKDDQKSIQHKQQRAISFGDSGEATDPLADTEIPMLKPLDLLAFQRPGVQHGVYKNLRLGKYNIDATLDLHRMTVEEARRRLYRFVQDCLDNDVRTALVTHGKGELREKPALLKSCVAHWLPQIDEVLAFHTAQKHHGSYGATYVLLKKSEKKKQQNREKIKNAPRG